MSDSLSSSYRVDEKPEVFFDYVAIATHVERWTEDRALADRTVDAIRGFIRSLGTLPHRGTLRDDLRPGLRIAPFSFSEGLSPDPPPRGMKPRWGAPTHEPTLAIARCAPSSRAACSSWPSASSQKRTAVAFVVDDAARTVTVLRVFYGGQDYEAVLRR